MQYSWRAFKNVTKQKLKQGPFKLKDDHGQLQPPVNEAIAVPKLLPNFLSVEECNKILEFSDSLNFSTGTIGGDDRAASVRKSEISWLYPQENNNWIFDYVETAIKKINKEYKFELFGFFQGMQIAKYGKRGEYGWHSDVGEGRASHRKLSISILLNDPKEYVGGDLEFMGINGHVPKTQGTAIIFPSYLVHRVTPIESGMRQSLVSWISGPPFR